MHLRRLAADEAAVRRYVEDLWLPYNRDLESSVENFALDEDVDVVEEETEFRIDRLESDGYRAWVAVEGERSSADLADVDADLAGFVTTSIDEAPSVFDRPDRLMVGDFYVREAHRGTGLARDLLERAAQRAREVGCEQLQLDVDVGNERAIGFYEKVGFEPHRHRMMVDVGEV